MPLSRFWAFLHLVMEIRAVMHDSLSLSYTHTHTLLYLGAGGLLRQCLMSHHTPLLTHLIVLMFEFT